MTEDPAAAGNGRWKAVLDRGAAWEGPWRGSPCPWWPVSSAWSPSTSPTHSSSARLGTTELAALSFTFPFVLVLVRFTLGLGIGASALVSRAVGRGDAHAVRRITTDSLALALLVVIIFVAAGFPLMGPGLQGSRGAGGDIPAGKDIHVDLARRPPLRLLPDGQQQCHPRQRRHEDPSHDHAHRGRRQRDPRLSPDIRDRALPEARPGRRRPGDRDIADDHICPLLLYRPFQDEDAHLRKGSLLRGPRFVEADTVYRDPGGVDPRDRPDRDRRDNRPDSPRRAEGGRGFRCGDEDRVLRDSRSLRPLERAQPVHRPELGRSEERSRQKRDIARQQVRLLLGARDVRRVSPSSPGLSRRYSAGTPRSSRRSSST